MLDWVWKVNALKSCEAAFVVLSDQAVGILALVLMFFFLASLLRK